MQLISLLDTGWPHGYPYGAATIDMGRLVRQLRHPPTVASLPGGLHHFA